jgi:23S rRNA pseudouridine1911/1915/1917 synthase
LTQWRVAARFSVGAKAGTALTLVRLFPMTGRTHQIRVHLADIKFPLVGDRLYGGAKTANVKDNNPELSLLLAFPRHALHAERLSVDHPRSGERLQLYAPVAADMHSALMALQKWQTAA